MVTCSINELHQKLGVVGTICENYRYTTKKNNEMHQQCTEKEAFVFVHTIVLRTSFFIFSFFFVQSHRVEMQRNF